MNLHLDSMMSLASPTQVNNSPQVNHGNHGMIPGIGVMTNQGVSVSLHSNSISDSISGLLKESSPPQPGKRKRDSSGQKRFQVKKACVNCRTSHTACSDSRPCERCISRKMEETCRDIPRKKRVRTSSGSVPTPSVGGVISGPGGVMPGVVSSGNQQGNMLDSSQALLIEGYKRKAEQHQNHENTMDMKTDPYTYSLLYNFPYVNQVNGNNHHQVSSDGHYSQNHDTNGNEDYSHSSSDLNVDLDSNPNHHHHDLQSGNHHHHDHHNHHHDHYANVHMPNPHGVDLGRMDHHQMDLNSDLRLEDIRRSTELEPKDSDYTSQVEGNVVVKKTLDSAVDFNEYES